MGRPIYKYMGASYQDAVFNAPGFVTLKCSYPKDFNDPYELFLTVDYKVEPELLAYYAEAIGELPQLPTTCFSRSPIVVPMWAHYAEALRGFVLEFGESQLTELLPGVTFRDVDYQDESSGGLDELLRRAYYLKKMRYTYMLQGRVFSAAYFTKAAVWSYEQERRMLVDESGTRHDGNSIFLDVPSNCVTAVLVGPRASKATSESLQATADDLGCPLFDMRIGKSTAIPFFVDGQGRSYHFDGSVIGEAEWTCEGCGEPVDPKNHRCSWCQITEAHVEDAARSNPFRMLARFGMLDSYIERMNEIRRRHSEE